MLLILGAFLFALLALGAVNLRRNRRFRRRERSLLIDDLVEVLRPVLTPATAAEVSFTGPYRFDEDRAHDTMFTARHGHRRLSFILDTRGARLRWWALSELFAPDGTRSLRRETTFRDDELPAIDIRILLKAARGEAVSPPPVETPVETAPTPPADPSAAPTEPASEPTAQA